jgi:hypothetical protein
MDAPRRALLPAVILFTGLKLLPGGGAAMAGKERRPRDQTVADRCDGAGYAALAIEFTRSAICVSR